MKASILTGPGKLELVNIPIPKLGSRDVLVKVDCVGICGTDVSVYRGFYNAKENIILGHEFCGEVVEVGEDVVKVKPSDYIISEASWGCNSCYWCNSGYPSYCEAPNMLGRTINGSLAEYIVVPDVVLHKIDKGVSPTEGQSAVGVATALRAVHRSGMRFQDKVLIVGPGYSGLIMLQLCKIGGAGFIVMAGTRENRLDIAKNTGADFTVNVKLNPDWEKTLLKDYVPQGFDICIEASGTVSGLLSCIKLVKKGGTVVQFGASFDMIDNLPQKDFYSREISLIGSKGGYGFYPRAVELLQNHRLKIEPLVTHNFGLDEVARAFEVMDRRLDNVLRAVVFCQK
ncbi:MAG: alcohol dehydrogenase catalytic domain-containing protein [Firmicutes bacterium]|nr:alcohol dehydrogenase catalytic domain-containing protein [Bacillota bacterium]